MEKNCNKKRTNLRVKVMAIGYFLNAKIFTNPICKKTKRYFKSSNQLKPKKIIGTHFLIDK